MPVRKSPGRYWLGGLNLLADFVTVTKSASKNILQKLGGSNSACRFSGLSPNLADREICRQKWWSNLLADLVTVTKSASREMYRQILVWWVKLAGHNLVTVTKSASQEIY